ncbi:hypothetical protein GWN91_03375, partial [Candidatus Saccharibacteria bacterium]|nr:hypothetical protein [Candidatus Saccharibacteria bacterium]NIW79083.1 hypothetical protein [Calditrichia bacterium]
MLPIYKYLSLLVFMLILIGCNKRVNDPAEKLSQDDRIDIEQFGERNTLEIATWNIEMFPMHNKTVSDVTEIILDLEIDIYAVQEITDNADFQRMLDSINVVDSLNQYDGRLNDEASFLKTGIIYKKSIVDVLADTHLFVGDNDFAGRPPYVLSVKAEKNNQIFDFNLIVLHLKAFDDPDSRARRQRAILK